MEQHDQGHFRLRLRWIVCVQLSSKWFAGRTYNNFLESDNGPDSPEGWNAALQFDRLMLPMMRQSFVSFCINWLT